MTDLHNTLMGRKLIEHDIPEIARQLKRIADSMDKIVGEKEEEKKELDEKKDNLSKIKRISINQLNFSNRVTNILKDKYKVNNLYDLIKLNYLDLEKTRGFGLQCRTEIKKTLDYLGLWVGISDYDIMNTKIKFDYIIEE